MRDQWITIKKKYIKYIIIGLILWNVLFSILLIFSYDPQYDTLKSITIDCLKFNAGYFWSIVDLYILEKIAIKIEEKYPN